MSVLLYGIALILVAFLIHLCVWKIYLPKNQKRALLFIFFGTLLAGAIVLRKFSAEDLRLFGIPAPQSPYDYIRLSAMFISLLLAYMVTYSAIEVDSPSLLQILIIAKAGKVGLEEKEFRRLMSDELLVKPRIKDLVDDKLVYLENGKYKLAKNGALVARIFIFYRSLLKLGKGG